MENNKQDYKEMIILRGIGHELTNMAYPRISNLRSMLETIGYILSKTESQSKETIGEPRKRELLLDSNSVTNY